MINFDFKGLTPIVKTVGIIIIIIILIFLIRSFLKAKKEDEQEKAENQLSQEESLALNAATGSGSIVSGIPKNDLAKAKANLTKFPVKELADKLYKAHGTFNDNESAVYSVFSIIKTKLELSYLNMYFAMLYKQPLLNFLQSFLDTEEMSKINAIVQKYKPY